VNSHFKLPKAKGYKLSEKGSVGTLFASNDTLISFLEKDFEGRDPEEYILAKDSGAPWFANECSYTRTFAKKLNKLGIFGKQPWHAFRHTGAIELFEITGDIYIVKTFLRHELIETTKRYLNSNRVNHVVEKNMNFLGKKTVKTLRNQEPKTKLIEINPKKLLEVA
jgi:integrase